MKELVCVSGVELLMDYLEGVLPEETRLAIDAHVASCPKCTAFVASYRATPRILRDATGLQRALATLGQLDDALSRTGVADGQRVFNLTWHDWINLKSLIAVSRVIATAALGREDSRGAHFREDFPETGPLPGSSYSIARLSRQRLELSHRPVAFTRVAPGQTLLEPAVAP